MARRDQSQETTIRMASSGPSFENLSPGESHSNVACSSHTTVPTPAKARSNAEAISRSSSALSKTPGQQITSVFGLYHKGSAPHGDGDNFKKHTPELIFESIPLSEMCTPKGSDAHSQTTSGADKAQYRKSRFVESIDPAQPLDLLIVPEKHGEAGSTAHVDGHLASSDLHSESQSSTRRLHKEGSEGKSALWSSSGPLESLQAASMRVIAAANATSEHTKRLARSRRLSWLRSSDSMSRSSRRNRSSADSTDLLLDPVPSPQLVKRREILEEILASEEGYLRDLRVLSRVSGRHSPPESR